MSETTFENAKVGDRVWDFKYGSGVIYSILKDRVFCIWVKFDMGVDHTYTTFGSIDAGKSNRTLFWSEIKYEIPVRPKRKVKKEVRGWVNVFPEGHSTVINQSKHEADMIIRNDRIACVEVSGEYEVEE